MVCRTAIQCHVANRIYERDNLRNLCSTRWDESARAETLSMARSRELLMAKRARQDYRAGERREPLIRAFHLGRPLVGSSHHATRIYT